MNPVPPVPTSFSALPVAGAPDSGHRRRVCIASFDFVGPVKNGGVGTAFTSLGEGLAAAGHDVTLLYLAGDWCENQTLAHWIAYYAKKNIRFVPLPDSGLKINSRWHVNKAYEAYLWLKEQAFDVIHFSEWKGPGYFVLRAKAQGLGFAEAQLCVHTHGPTLWHKLSNGEYVTNIDDVELDYLERHSVRLADVVVSPSRYLLRWMLERGWVLPTACFVQQYVRPATARQPKSGADRVQPVDELVFFGRLEVRKGLVLFCDALDVLAAQGGARPDRVSFLGKSDRVNGRSSNEYLAGRARGWPWPIEVVSDRDQAGAMNYLQEPGRLAVIPSLVDNLPNTVLECLGAQVPFLASDAGGIPEMIAADDLAATTFPLRSTAFAAKLATALRDGVRPARYAVDQRENEHAWGRWHRTLPAAGVPTPSVALPAAPRVTICVSHWNRPHYLRQALASIEAQDYQNYDVVLIDDGSTTPEARAYIAELESGFAARGWTLLRNTENRYPGAARNRAAQHAQGDYILFMDDDNCAKPQAVSTFVRVALRTGADIVTCCLDTFAGAAAPHAGQKPTARWLFLGDDVASGACRNNFGDTNGLWRREVFARSGGFHEDWGVGHEDWELLAKAVLHGARLEVVPEPLAWYRLNEAEATVNRKTPPHANHLANIRPYLDAVRPELRHLVLFAQGAYLRPPMLDEAAIDKLVQMQSLWRGKLEAALLFVEAGQDKIAAKLMLEAIKAVESTKHPKVILDAILGVSPHLGRIDPGRARFLLGLAVKSAESFGRTAERDRARQLLAELTPAPVAREAVPA